MNSIFKTAERLQQLPPYLFARIDQLKQKEMQKGRKLINLGVGDPDLPTPDFIIEAFSEAVKNPLHHQYPSYSGMNEFKKAICQWYQERFSVSLHPDNQALVLIGSKEGIAHLPLAFVNPSEAVLVPDPGYPVYQAATLIAGGIPLSFSLQEKNQFLPEISELEHLIQKGPKVRLLFLNYPNNPTSAVANLDFFKEIVKLAKKYEFIVCHDNAYSEIYFNEEKPISFLQTPGALDIGCEFHSLSKTFNMAGWRVGFVVGNEAILQGLGQIKTNIDSGLFNACQMAGVAALKHSEPFCSQLRAIYQERKNVFLQILNQLRLVPHPPKATFYIWAKLNPETQLNSEDYVAHLIKTIGLISTPGRGFGLYGEHYIRFALCCDVNLLKDLAKNQTLMLP